MIYSNGKTELVNFRVDGNRYVVDRLFDKAVLILGVGKKQKKVTITRSQDYAESANSGGRG
jgi:type IV secretory pathway VirB9-like protein